MRISKPLVGLGIFSMAYAMPMHGQAPPCTGNQIVVSLLTDFAGAETTWEIRDGSNALVASGGPYTGLNFTQIRDTVCLGASVVDEWYTFKLMDSFGDGFHGMGDWELTTVDGRLVLRDEFPNGASSPPASPMSPAYGIGHSFSLPLGEGEIHPAECGVFDNGPDNKVYAMKQTGTNYQGGTLNYQFEFSNPDSGRIRRIAVPRNYVIFSQMAGLKPLVSGERYFTRVRTDKNGPIAAQHWGGGCEMGLGNTVPCTQLIDDPNHQYFSCGVTKRFKKGSWLVAQPVYGATQYEFRVYIPGEYDHTFVRNNYKLELGWPASEGPPLMNGSLYHVQVRVKVNNLWGSYCNDCGVLINNNQHAQQNSLVQVFGEATLWPNPARNGQVNLNIDGIGSDVQHITVDMRDIYGQQVYGREFGNAGDRFNTVLDLPGDIATGIYLVNITVNGEVATKRLSIVR